MTLHRNNLYWKRQLMKDQRSQVESLIPIKLNLHLNNHHSSQWIYSQLLNLVQLIITKILLQVVHSVYLKRQLYKSRPPQIYNKIWMTIRENKMRKKIMRTIKMDLMSMMKTKIWRRNKRKRIYWLCLRSKLKLFLY